MPTPKPQRPRPENDPILSMTDSAAPRSRIPRSSPVAGTLAFLLEVVKVVVFALAIIVPVRYFLVQPFYVKGASMEPNFEDREYLLIDELSYRFRDPARGEVVVLRNPVRPSEFFIKRVIGLPGEHIEFADGRVRVVTTADPQGFTLDESVYLSSNVPTTANASRSVLDLGPDEYAVFGDNRPFSLDSRSFGPINRKSIVGRVWIRALPTSRFGIFQPPAYQAVTP